MIFGTRLGHISHFVSIDFSDVFSNAFLNELSYHDEGAEHCDARGDKLSDLTPIS